MILETLTSLKISQIKALESLEILKSLQFKLQRRKKIHLQSSWEMLLHLRCLKLTNFSQRLKHAKWRIRLLSNKLKTMDILKRQKSLNKITLEILMNLNLFNIPRKLQNMKILISHLLMTLVILTMSPLSKTKNICQMSNKQKLRQRT